MDVLNLSEKARFFALSPVTVRAENLLFYFTPGGLEFNLPKGSYEVEGIFYEVPFTFVKIPFPELDIKKPLIRPKKFSFQFVKDYPHTCSVYLNTGKVVADEKFKFLPRHVRTFVFFHEFGHFYFRGEGQKSEKLCDKFARVMMLKLGFNPSQIDLACSITLSESDEARERKKVSFEQLKKKK